MTDPCEFLPWDSGFFGVRIAQVKEHRLTPQFARHTIEWLDAHRIDCAYFLADAGDTVTLRLAPQHGFDLVDVRVTLEAGPTGVHSPPSPAPVRPARLADSPALQAMARVSHRDSRFYADGRFPVSRCDDLFAAWIANSLDGFADVVLAGERDGRVAGYMTGRLVSGDIGHIGLVAVAPDARGQGVGRALTAALMRWFDARGVAHVAVVTQGKNADALRFYQRCGFRISNIALWYHRWSASGDPDRLRLATELASDLRQAGPHGTGSQA